MKVIIVYKLLITIIITALASNVDISASEPKSKGVLARIKEVLFNARGGDNKLREDLIEIKNALPVSITGDLPKEDLYDDGHGRKCTKPSVGVNGLGIIVASKSCHEYYGSHLVTMHYRLSKDPIDNSYKTTTNSWDSIFYIQHGVGMPWDCMPDCVEQDLKKSISRFESCR